MDDFSLVIQKSINERAKLLSDADLLEEEAKSLREKAGVNNLSLEIKGLQDEIFRLLDKYELLNNLIVLASNLFNNGQFSINNEVAQIPISLETYKTCSFQGRTIEMIESELVDVTTKIVLYIGLLGQLCDCVGHNYMFVKKDSVFDFSGMETTFEERAIHYCSICGDAIHTDLNGEKVVESARLNVLKKLRKARKMSIYKSKFKIVDNLHR